MRPSDPVDMESLLRKLLGKVDLAGARSAEPCPDENLLAGFAEGRLAPAERDGIAAHLEHCRACGEIVAELADDEGATAAASAAPPARLRLSPALLLAAAAVVVAGIAIGGWQVFFARGARDTQAELVACVRTLAHDRADLFDGFTPLDSAERLAPGPTLRGGDELKLVRPAATILEPRPDFVWEAVAGATSCTVTLLRIDGKQLWREPSAAAEPRLAWPQGQPDLERGATYQWKLSCETPLGPLSNRRPFTVASAQLRERFDAQTRALEGAVTAELRPLLLAHVAIRAGLLLEAERAARRFVAARPDDAVGRETLYCVLKQLESSEAEQWKAPPAGAGGK